MTETDKPRFYRALVALGEVYSDALSGARMALYFSALSRFDIQDLERAMTQLVAQPGRKFMPKPGEIVEVIEGLPEDRALTAWSRIERAQAAVGPYLSVDFRDPIIHTMIVRYGGWPTVANWWRDLDEQALGYKRHAFLQEFKVAERLAASMPSEQIDHLPGIFEIENAQTRGSWTRGDLLHRDDVEVIGPSGEPVAHRMLPAPTGRAALPEAAPAEPVDVKSLVQSVVKSLPTHEDVLRDKVRFDREQEAKP